MLPTCAIPMALQGLKFGQCPENGPGSCKLRRVSICLAEAVKADPALRAPSHASTK